VPDPLGSLDLQLTEQLRFILDLGAALAAALVGGALAVRLRQPAIVGYLLAGIVIGPFTPGFVGDVERISVLADVGIVLLLFALGIQFSIRELREVGRVAVPGGVLRCSRSWRSAAAPGWRSGWICGPPWSWAPASRSARHW